MIRSPRLWTWGLLITAGVACDGDARVASSFGTGRSDGRALPRAGDRAGGEGGEGGEGAEGGATERRQDVAEGPCPLGSRRWCKVVTTAGCLEGSQHCVDGSWSECVRDVGGEDTGGAEDAEGEGGAPAG